MTFDVTIADTGEVFSCAADQTVLEGMVRLGRRGIPAGCRGGGCGVCKIEVLKGEYEAQIMSRDHVSPDDRAQNRVLACRIMPRSNLTVRVIGKMTKAWTFGTAPASTGTVCDGATP